jgi:hypothetical protein
MIYTAPSLMFWMRAYLLRGEVGGGWALEFSSFLGPVKWHGETIGECHLGPKGQMTSIKLASYLVRVLTSRLGGHEYNPQQVQNLQC